MRGVGVIAATVLAAGALAAGCGDDDDETTTGATGATRASGVELSESEYRAQANEICRAGEREIEQASEGAFRRSEGRPSDQAIEDFATETIIPDIQGQIDAIGALTPPEDRADEFEGFVDDAQAALDELEADPSLITEEGNRDPFADVNELARDLGLEECGG